MTPMELEQTRAQFYDWLKSVEYRNWKFTVRQEDDQLYLQLRWLEPCGMSAIPKLSDKHPLTPYMTKSEFVEACLKAVLAATGQEVLKQFKYKDQAIYRPPHDVDALHSLCTTKERKAS